MRAFPAMVLVMFSALAAGPSRAAAAANGAGRAEISGQAYVQLGDWARVNGFDLRWIKRDEIVALTNRTWRLVFTKDSRNMELNGVNVSLSFPIALRNGTGYLAQADVEKTLRPVFVPPKNRPGAAIRNITLDPGHGGKDPGFQVGPYQEKKYTLLLALELRDQLKRAGFNVSLTRTTDKAVDKHERPGIAQGQGADLFISLHWNTVTAGKAEVQGAQTYSLTPAGAPSSSDSGEDLSDTGARAGNPNDDKNMFLAYVIQKSLVNNLGVEDHGARRARYTVLCGAEMPAVLIEGGYMSNPAESRRIYDPAYRKRMASAIVQGITAYQRQVEQPLPPPMNTNGPSTGARGGTRR
jgi:N-acetylmuramoyl-L-alanine amidase